MSDMELSGNGEDGDGSEDYCCGPGEMAYHDGNIQGIAMPPTHLIRQGKQQERY